ncbi:MAG: YbjN domain-containing protein [Acidobacteriota bacterium]
MSDDFDRVKSILVDLDLSIVQEDAAEELVVVQDEEAGIVNLLIDCEDPLLVLEQHIFRVPEAASPKLYERLLQINRTTVHGAFVLDEEGENVFFRDTLQLPTLDPAELESSIAALSLALAENAGELLELAGH